MQKSSIIVLSLVLVVVLVMVFSLIDASSYATFADAKAEEGKTLTIIGTLNKEKGVKYDPVVNANRTEFYVKDKAGQEEMVIFHDAKPRDIEKSEEITMEGKMVKGKFHAVHILLKCPSKYQPNEVGVKDSTKRFYAPIPQ